MFVAQIAETIERVLGDGRRETMVAGTVVAARLGNVIAAATLRHVKRLLDSFRRHPEKAKRVKLLVERFERKKALPR
jgi:hypothetical protein